MAERKAATAGKGGAAKARSAAGTRKAPAAKRGAPAAKARSAAGTRKAPPAKARSTAGKAGKAPRAGASRMFPRILCPLDFSDPSLIALREAVKLARTFSSKLYLLHVISSAYLAESIPASPEFDLVPYQKELLRSGRQKMKETAEKEVPPGLESKQFVVNGAIDEEIINLAKKEKIALVVIATHGRTGWRHLVFGSVTEKVIRQAPCPVLTVHPEKE